MYTFTNKLRNLSIILMVAGFLGLTYGFLSAPNTIEDAQAMVDDTHHGDGHGASHGEATPDSDHTESHADEKHHHQASAHGEQDGNDHSQEHGGDHHGEHLLHQLQNKPWAALYVAAFFFMMIALGTLAFYAINRAAQAGWSPALFRVMEGITAYLLPGALIVFVILGLSGMHFNHLFIWMDPEVVAHDKLIQGKAGFLNVPGFLIRALIYISGWVTYRHFSRKFSLAQDKAQDISNHKKNFRISAGFLVFFIVTESMMSWDWIMSIDPHWFSTLFGWYVFASMFVSGITVIALMTIYLKSKGHLEIVNDSHIHDLAKFMFGISIFWTYLWFSQFMLIWYADIPEEITYFQARINDYPVIYWMIFFTNFAVPMLFLMDADAKKNKNVLILVGCIVFVFHWLDVFIMTSPGSMKAEAGLGLIEIGSFLLFLGVFTFIVLRSLASRPLMVKNHPYLEEGKAIHHH